MRLRPTKNIVRIWNETRSSHFELLHQLKDSTLIYQRENYSFDRTLVGDLDVRRIGTLRTLAVIAFGKQSFTEFNEPTMFKAWHKLFLYCAVQRLRRALSANPPIAILYAIDNMSLADSVAATIRLPESIVRHLVRPALKFLLGTFDRVAFGSDGARRAYSDVLGSWVPRSCETIVVPQLPRRCDCDYAVASEPNRVLFVGAFEERKGVPQLLAAWEEMSDVAPDLSLQVIGVGKLEREVEEWCKRHGVAFSVDPPRTDVHMAYSKSRVVVLLSQRTPRWREQVGLPIVEGLAHGCVIVTTTETGVARWLEEAGHTVLPTDASSREVALAISLAATQGPSDHAVLDSLPLEHTRITADRWLTR